MKNIIAAIAILACAAAYAATAAFSYQGRLMNAEGTAPLQGIQTLELRLYDAATGGTALWGRAYSVLLDENGLFNAEVSDLSGSPLEGIPDDTLDKVFSLCASKTIYVGLKVDGTSGEIAPRQKLLAVPYATFANDVAEAKSDFSVSGRLTAQNVSVSNSLTAASVSVSGAASAATLTTSGNATVKGNLTVNGTIAGSGIVPVTGIILWSGSTVPDGWALCDGTHGTPNLSGRFIVGAGQGNGLSNYAVGETGGEERHKLTVEEMPSHRHPYKFRGADIADDWEGDNELYSVSKQYYMNTAYTENAGGDKAHENRPPYYVLAFIMRVR